MTISVIINTIDRPETLLKCLQGLKNQDDKDFEVILVDQSEGDETRLLCKKYNLKYLRSEVRNISISRNIGVQNASGDIVAFIDDDAVANSDWISRIKDNFLNNSIDLLAGKVIDMSDSKNPRVQFQNGIISDYGNNIDVRPSNLRDYQKVEKDNWHLFALGVNSIFLKQSVLKVNGFDEYYEYIHDESDLASRIMFAGGRAKYDDKLIVNHYLANSHNRRSKYHLNWRVITKNYIYFALKNGRDSLPKRIVRSIYRIIGPNGTYYRVFRFFRERYIDIFAVPKVFLLVTVGFIQGFFAGIFLKRKLRKIISSDDYIRFS